MKKNKILFYIDPQSYNNLSIYDKSLLEQVKGWDIYYFHNVKYQCERIPGVNYIPAFAYSDLSGLKKLASYVASIKRVIQAARRLHPSVVHIQWFKFFPVDVFLVACLHLMHCKIVYTAHNVLPLTKHRRDKFVFRWFYRHADAIIVHTENSKRELVKLCPSAESKVNVIRHGMLSTALDNAAVSDRCKALEEKFQAKGKIVFASMGYQNYYKGIDILAEAWASSPLLGGNDKVALFIVGKSEGAHYDNLKDCSNVYIVNEVVSDLDFDAYLRLASAVVLPYRRIYQSGFLFTALQRGVPVIVSNVGGLPEPLKLAKVGWNIGETSVDNLKKALETIVQAPDSLFAIKNDREAFETVRKEYSWDKIGQQTSELYTRVLS